MPSLEDCSNISRAKLVSVAESGRRAVFQNPDRRQFRLTKIDGCVVLNAVAADWLISSIEGDLVLELKGCDVEHAVDQVLATMTFWRANGPTNRSLAGLIVCKRYPALDTKVQRAKNRVRKQFAAKLHVTRQEEHKFEQLF